MESSITVCDTIIGLINKRETIQEYSYNEDFNDIIMESMMIFMESKNRERDKTPRNEIAKWMESKGYWYTGDNPKKKKECNRMYHFLQQYKFDPKTETYESDIDDGKGGKKRIKLKIDPSLTKDETRKLLSLAEKYKNGEIDDDEETEFYKLKGDSNFYDAVKKGRNASYSRKKEETDIGAISIGSKTLKQKQASPNTTIKHEEGHVDSNYRGNNGDPDKTLEFANKNLPDDHPAAVALRKHKKSGKYVNDHDDSTEELMADRYSAEHSNHRTKNWGKSKETRKYNKSEFIKGFNKIYGTVKEYNETIANIQKSNAEMLENKKKQLAAIDSADFSKVADALKQDIDMGVKKFVDVVETCLKDYGVYTLDLNSERESSVYDFSSTLFNPFDISDAEFCENYIKELTEVKKELENTKTFIKSMDQDDVYYDKRFSKQRDIFFHGGLDSLKQRVEKLERNLEYYRESCKHFRNKTKNRDWNLLYSKCKNNVKTNNPEKIEKDIKEFIAPYKVGLKDRLSICERLSKDAEKAVSETRKLRMDFATEVLKEYFEELCDDYFFYD